MTDEELRIRKSPNNHLSEGVITPLKLRGCSWNRKFQKKRYEPDHRVITANVRIDRAMES